jgi:hypothetical protein
MEFVGHGGGGYQRIGLGDGGLTRYLDDHRERQRISSIDRANGFAAGTGFDCGNSGEVIDRERSHAAVRSDWSLHRR